MTSAPDPTRNHADAEHPDYVVVHILVADSTITSDGKTVTSDGTVVTTPVRIPKEAWQEGPIGTRVQIVDFDSSIEKHYLVDSSGDEPTLTCAFDPQLLRSAPTTKELALPEYQACNLFATAMATIGQFERALGRRVAFATDTHQIKLAPHAFVGANAYYDRASEAIIFGYFRGANEAWVDTSLSYDVVVHEMSHAILDGLRPRFSDPSSPDQAAFHEAFADIVAILSTLTRREVVRWALQKEVNASGASLEQILSALRASFLGAIAPQLGDQMAQRGRALRESFRLLDLRQQSPGEARTLYPERKEAGEPHGLGEVLVVAVLTTFHDLLIKRLAAVMPRSAEGAPTPIELVADEASRAADLLLTLCIQAVDYTPPVHMQFPDYLSALLTVYHELHGTSGRLDLLLRKSFESFGIDPAKGGRWTPFEGKLEYRGVRFDQIQTDRDEAFRFVFANLQKLDLDPHGYTRVLSVRPSSRVSPDDGFVVRETVIECLQRLRLDRAELRKRLTVDSVGLGAEEDILDLRGGTTLILGDHGQVKYSIHKRLIPETSKQDAAERIGYLDQLERTGWVTRQAGAGDFAELHRLSQRASDSRDDDEEVW